MADQTKPDASSADQRFSFRPVRADDKPAVQAICAKIWDGDDYLPKLFDTWLADPAGAFTACLYDGRLVGCAKLSFLAPGHAWLEGLRKDLDAPLKGVGQALARNHLARLATLPELCSVRFATYAADRASIALNEKLGFRRIATATMRSKCLDPAAADHDPSVLITPAAAAAAQARAACTIQAECDATAAWAQLRAAGWYEHFLYSAWRAWPATGPVILEPRLAAGCCLVAIDSAGQRRGVIVWDVDRHKGLLTIVGLAAADSATAGALLARAEQAAVAAGLPDIEIPVQGAAANLALLDSWGYTAWDGDDDFLVYELPLAVLERYR
jgi:RimJ/RimL family protein N-acetyltransferase